MAAGSALFRILQALGRVRTGAGRAAKAPFKGINRVMSHPFVKKHGYKIDLGLGVTGGIGGAALEIGRQKHFNKTNLEQQQTVDELRKKYKLSPLNRTGQPSIHVMTRERMAQIKWAQHQDELRTKNKLPPLKRKVKRV